MILLPKVESKPRVSVVMPVYNEERYLALALDSILCQTFEDFELIVIDDASTDGTASILAEYQARDPRIRVLTNAENRGVAANLNVGLRLARGELIARMDGDDICLPERLRAQVEFLDAHPDHVLVGAACRTIDAEGRVRKTDIEATETWEFSWISLFRPPLVHASAMFRAWLVREKGLYYNEQYRAAEDFDFWIRMLDYGKAASVARPLIFHRKHSQNASVRRFAEQKRESSAIAFHHLIRRYPDLCPHGALLRRFFERLFYQRSSGPDTLCDVVDAMALIERRFLRDHDLTVRQKCRVHALAARWIMMATLRSGELAQLFGVLKFLWRARSYWQAIAREAVSFITRRLWRANRPFATHISTELPTGT